MVSSPCLSPIAPPLPASRVPPSPRSRGEGWGRGRPRRSGSLPAREGVATRLAVWRETVSRERFLDAVVKHADLADAASLPAARDLAAEFARDAHELLD